MTPSLAKDDQADERLGYPESFGDTALTLASRVGTTDIPDTVVAHLGLCVLATPTSTAVAQGVSHVLRHRAIGEIRREVVVLVVVAMKDFGMGTGSGGE